MNERDRGSVKKENVCCFNTLTRLPNGRKGYRMNSAHEKERQICSLLPVFFFFISSSEKRNWNSSSSNLNIQETKNLNSIPRPFNHTYSSPEGEKVIQQKRLKTEGEGEKEKTKKKTKKPPEKRYKKSYFMTLNELFQLSYYTRCNLEK